MPCCSQFSNGVEAAQRRLDLDWNLAKPRLHLFHFELIRVLALFTRHVAADPMTAILASPSASHLTGEVRSADQDETLQTSG